MRITWVALLLAAACGSTQSPPRAATPSSAAPLVRRPVGDVVLFVRDATRLAPRLASLVCSRLVAAGVRCRALQPASAEATSWAADAAAARASGATWAIRVTVVDRHEAVDVRHQAEWMSRDASGLVGRRATVDVGATTRDDDLRLDIAASLRRTRDELLLARWSDSGGALDAGGGATSDARWTAIYDDMAARVAERILAALAHADR